MKRTIRICSVLCLMGMAGILKVNQLYGQQKKPNIIFILTDDQGYGDVGVFFQKQRAKEGKPYERSPYLDKLAESGAIFTQQYAAAPVCAPSRASLMLGVSQGHSNVRNNEFDRAIDSNYTMASTLQSLGYATIAIGKWGLQGSKPWDKDGDDWNARPTNRGFDQFFGYMRHMDGHEHYPKEALYFPNHQQVEVWDHGQNITPELDKCYTPDLWTAYAKKWITDHQQAQGKDKDKPFFMYLAFETPHAVLELPTQAYPKGQGLHGGLKWLGTPGHMINTATGTPDSYIHPDYASATYDDDNNPATKEVPWPDTYKRYAMSNRRIDYCVGDLMALLKDLKIEDNTIIVFTSDNGPSIEDYLPKGYVHVEPTFFASYGPFDGIKRDDWEGGVRMPVIAAWPGHIPAGSVITKPSVSYDWAATFIQAAGAIPPARMDGVSLLPELTGKGQQQPSQIYNEYFFPGKTPNFKEFAPAHRGRVRGQMQLMRLDSFVAVRYNVKSASDNFEIYNVVSDPQQTRNLALTPTLPVKLDSPAPASASFRTVSDLQTYFKAKVLQSRRPEKWAKRPYDSALVPAVHATAIQGGLNWQFYKGHYSWIPQVSALKGTQRGHIATIQLEGLKAVQSGREGLLMLEGYIKAPTDGNYTFYLSAQSNAFVKLHDMQLIDADFGYTPGTEKTAQVFLKAGLHPVRLYYNQKDVRKVNKITEAKDHIPLLQLSWSGPGFSKEPIAPENLFSRKK
ncbi:sulfatase-like hydrolase/transferase [Arachidicoccus ginsenosidivorans]